MGFGEPRYKQLTPANGGESMGFPEIISPLQMEL